MVSCSISPNAMSDVGNSSSKELQSHAKRWKVTIYTYLGIYKRTKHMVVSTMNLIVLNLIIVYIR